MLKSLDVLIGLAVVMLVLSLAVTVVTQFINSQLLNLQGKALKVGLGRLLTLLDAKITPDDGRQIADYVLRHYLVSRNGRLAQTIHREEFTKLVLDYAANGVGLTADRQQKATDDQADADVRARLLEVVKANGVPDPVAALEAARKMAMELEAREPQLANNVRQTAALVEHVGGDYLAKINAWFDQTVDRVTDVVNVHSRWATVAVSALVAIALHVNTLDVINRLSNDTGLRDTIVKAAVEHPERFALPTNETPAKDARTMLTSITHDPDFAGLTDANVIVIPGSTADWIHYWVNPAADDTAQRRAGDTLILGRIAGVLLTIGLLSLGAPLWYQLLGNLLSLRSIVARRDDQQRAERQTTQTPAVPVRAVDAGPPRQITDPSA